MADPAPAAIRLLWRIAVATLGGLALVITAWAATSGLPPLSLAGLALLVVLAGSLLAYRRGVGAAAARWQAGEESSKRFLAGLSRSISPDSIVEAIVEELRQASGSDHVIVARLRQDDRLLETTLVSGSRVVPASTTTLVADLLDRPLPGGGSNGGGPGVPVMEPYPKAVAAGVRARAMSAAASVSRVGRVRPMPPDERPAVNGSSTDEVRGRPSGDGRSLGEPRVQAIREQAPHSSIAERIAGVVRRAYGLKHTLAAPLVANDRVIGALVLSRRTGEAWSPGSRAVLDWAAAEASAALARAYAHEAAETRASIDALTGLPNRRYLDDLAAVLSIRRRRAGDAIGALMVDIDRFKQLNDRHGHATGDVVLRRVAAAIAAAVRGEDVPARYGGEEFAVVLRQATYEQAVEVAERLRRAVAELPLAELGVDEPVSVSVGVAVSREREMSLEELFAEADRAMYAAKRSGRDRVVVG